MLLGVVKKGRAARVFSIEERCFYQIAKRFIFGGRACVVKQITWSPLESKNSLPSSGLPFSPCGRRWRTSTDASRMRGLSSADTNPSCGLSLTLEGAHVYRGLDRTRAVKRTRGERISTSA